MTAYTTPMSDPTDVTGRRIGAWAIDLLIYLVLLAAVLLPTGAVKVQTYTGLNGESGTFYCKQWNKDHNGYCQNNNGDVTTVEGGAGASAFWLGHLVLYILIQGLAGGSLGKLAVGLRVVDEQGNQAGLGKSAVRTLLWVVDGIACGLPILGGILIVSTKGHRRIGDMAAGTYVVPKDQMGRPPMSAISNPMGVPVGAGWGAPPPPGAGAGWPSASPSAPGPSSWSPPPSTGSPEPTPWGASSDAPSPPAGTLPSGAASPTDTEGPTWDAARNAYIQYDRDQSAWVQWSDANQSWGPIAQ
ncbi:MAG: RDD family protein [Acidimicrobiales bacterium]